MQNSNKDLIPPCSYQGGKQRLSKQIVDIIFQENNINEYTKIYDLCCGSGAISLEFINRGIHPNNIIMVDISMWGKFWQSVANEEFDLKLFKDEIEKLPEKNHIQDYLMKINRSPLNIDLDIYHFLLQQSGSFGSKYIDIKDGKWLNSTFRNYWLPTETSNRKSPVNPMMPMPKTLYERVENIINCLSGCITAINCDISKVDWIFDENTIIYIDPPYKNTSGYANSFDYEYFLLKNRKNSNIYISEGYSMKDSDKSILLSKGRNKGNISGDIKKKPSEEWLNIYKK